MLGCLILAGMTPGCAHRVQVRSEPLGATVTYRGRDVGATPVELRARWWPWGSEIAQLEASGYRGMDIDLRQWLGPFRWRRRLLGEPSLTHTAVMVQTHGLSGSWGPADVPE